MTTINNATFPAELNAAGLLGLPFSWSSDGIEGRENLTDEQNAALDVVLAAHDPDKVIAAAVIAERERRLAEGFDYDFGDERGVHHIGTTDSDMIGWDEVTKLSNALLATGDTATTITILTATGLAEVTALEWQQILIASAAFRQPIWLASFALQAMDPIPTDYTDDAYWTADGKRLTYRDSQWARA